MGWELVVRREVLTGHALVLKVDPTENGRFHVRGQRIPPFVFESHHRFSPSRAVATIWGNHKSLTFSKRAAATLTRAAVTQTSGNSHGQLNKGGAEHHRTVTSKNILTMYLTNSVFQLSCLPTKMFIFKLTCIF